MGKPGLKQEKEDISHKGNQTDIWKNKLKKL
jgi:hypothetical protein